MVKSINISELESSGFYNLTAQLYNSNLLSKVPNTINQEYFYKAFYINNTARLVLYENPELKINNEKAIALGHFECANNLINSQLLFNEAQKMAKEMGAKWLIGPMNGSTWDSYRYSLNQDISNFFMEPFHHLYYNQLWQQAGFETIATYASSMDEKMDLFNLKYFEDFKMKLEDSGVIIRPIKLDNYETEIAKVHEFCEATFKNNFLYTPISQKAFIQKYLPIKNYINPEYVLMAENADKNLVAIFFAVPDVYNKSIPTLIVKTIARNPLPCYAGLIQIMCNMGIGKAKENGFKQTIHAFMHHDNKSNNVSQKFSGEVFRNYNLYGKKII